MTFFELANHFPPRSSHWPIISLYLALEGFKFKWWVIFFTFKVQSKLLFAKAEGFCLN
jgi:hypothetical protein